jgi:hypothetical protein
MKRWNAWGAFIRSSCKSNGFCRDRGLHPWGAFDLPANRTILQGTSFCTLRPAGVLAREAQHQLSHPIIDGRTPRGPLRLRPLAAHEFPMPAQQRLWRRDQATSAWLRQDSRQRGKEGAIGWAQRRASLLPPSTTS